MALDCRQTVQREIKGSKFEIFAGSSHLTMSEEPAKWVAALRRNLI